MKYKVGDKVRVRKDLVLGKSYDGWICTEEMFNLKGETVTIRAIHDDEHYHIEELEGCGWTDEMFEPVITNWDKVKEEIMIENECGIQIFVCKAIHRVRKEKYCDGWKCEDCKEWLKQPYKEPSILDEAEKKYLSAVIRPWRDKVKYVTKNEIDGEEFISMQVKCELIKFPNFKVNTMYKGMELNKEYTLDELGL